MNKKIILRAIRDFFCRHKSDFERSPRYRAMVISSRNARKFSKRYSRSMDTEEKRIAKSEEYERRLERIREAEALTEQRIQNNPRVFMK